MKVLQTIRSNSKNYSIHLETLNNILNEFLIELDLFDREKNVGFATIISQTVDFLVLPIVSIYSELLKYPNYIEILKLVNAYLLIFNQITKLFEIEENIKYKKEFKVLSISSKKLFILNRKISSA